jgi:hypothetical protein
VTLFSAAYAARWAWQPTLAAWTALTLAYGLGVWLWAAAPVLALVWLMLYLACVAASLFIQSKGLGGKTGTWWLAAAFYTLLFAAVFHGTDCALDVLHGAQRSKAHVADALGGLVLGYVLCPGAFSVAVGSALRVWIQAGQRAHGRG